MGGGDSILMARTQRPSCYFNPQDQRGCCMELPFIKQDNWITLSSVGPSQLQYQKQLENMGTMSLDSFTPLNLSNDSTGQAVEITVYAWATNVELMGPSAAFQSGKADEFGTTPISDAATSAAAVAGSLSSVPAIGNYAKATSMVMSGVSAVAKALGYSKPPNIAPVAPYRYLTNPSVANSTIPVPSDVLAIDPKAELTIDPRTICGGDKDPNLISEIIQKDTYWFTTTWQINDTTNTELVRFYVSPEIFREQVRTGSGAGNSYWVRQASPLCHMAQAFGYWQGDIIYTFHFVCSKYHRGRVRIFYEPEDIGAPTLDSGYNINHVVDIGSTTTFEMRVPYMRHTSWAKVEHSATSPGTGLLYRVREATGFYIPYNRETMNGTIRMSVLNDLSAPSTSADISILVTARAAENFSFAQPKAIRPLNEAENTEVSTWSGQVAYDDLVYFQSGEQDEPHQDHQMSVSIPAEVPRMDPYVFMGEKVTSLKQLFARTCHYAHIGPETEAAGYPNVTRLLVTTFTQPRFPRQYGPDAGGINASTYPGRALNYGYNFVNHTFLTWFTPAFTGWRGSVVWRVQPFEVKSDYDAANISMECTRKSGCNIERFPVKTYYVAYQPISGTSNLTGIEVDAESTGSSVGGSQFSRFFSQKFAFMNGTAATAPAMEPVNIASVPMYSSYRMHPCNPRLMSNSVEPATGEPISYDTDYSSDNVRFTLWGSNAIHGQNEFANPFALFVAGGDDFTPFFYLNVPTFYVGSSPGSPAGSGFQKPAKYAAY